MGKNIPQSFQRGCSWVLIPHVAWIKLSISFIGQVIFFPWQQEKNNMIQTTWVQCGLPVPPRYDQPQGQWQSLPYFCSSFLSLVFLVLLPPSSLGMLCGATLHCDPRPSFQGWNNNHQWALSHSTCRVFIIHTSGHSHFCFYLYNKLMCQPYFSSIENPLGPEPIAKDQWMLVIRDDEHSPLFNFWWKRQLWGWGPLRLPPISHKFLLWILCPTTSCPAGCRMGTPNPPLASSMLFPCLVLKFTLDI